MKPVIQPRLELEKAKRQISAMRSAERTEEFEDHWKAFLHSIERVWSKSEAYYGRSPKWNGWKYRYDALRKSDPLLSYLRNARGAEEHTIAEITRYEPGFVSVANIGNGRPVAISAGIDEHGATHVRADGNIQVAVTPSGVRLLDVKNRGRIYPAPTIHLQKSIDPFKVPELAELAVKFYSCLLDQADHFFTIK